MLNRIKLRLLITGADTRKKLYAITSSIATETADNTLLTAIQALKDPNFKRFRFIIVELLNMGLLTSESLNLALQRVTQKIPAVGKSTVSKTKLSFRKEFILDGKSTFFLDHGASRNIDASGGQGSVNKAYSTADEIAPSWSVKRFAKSEADYLRPRATLAEREARYLNFMGRHAKWYESKNGPVVIAKWQHGISIEDMVYVENKENFENYAFKRRLKWLISGLNDLEKLHTCFRLHGDIKPGNFILDIANDCMTLIDFGSAQKVNSTKEFAATAFFLDMNEGKPHKTGSDMFAMGFIVALLFPDLFRLDMRGWIFDPIPPYIVTKTKLSGLSNAEIAVNSLLDAMMEPIIADRCTNQQALLFCQQLAAMLDEKEKIDDDDLTTLLDSTINRKTYEIEDALRGSRRPKKFGAEPHQDHSGAHNKLKL